MFGQNPIRSKETNPFSLSVQSVFYTIQGEGPYSGMPCVFVRLAGCNLACWFCDTEFESQIDNRISNAEAVAQVLSRAELFWDRKLVVLTGGEPLRQNIIPFCEQLIEEGVQTIQIETAGTLWQDGLEALIASGHVVIVCSPKTIGVHPKIKQFCNHWKYVVRHGETLPSDGLPNRGTQGPTRGVFQTLARPPQREGVTTWVSPCDDHDPETSPLNQEEAKKSALFHGHRLSLQVHKIIDVE